MLEHLRQKVTAAISSVSTIMVSTYGPAGIQVENCPCQACGLRLYLLVPRTSELLFNIENHPEVIVTAPGWNLHGAAGVIPPELTTASLAGLRLGRLPEREWCEIVEIRPIRLQIHPADPDQARETIDVTE